MKFLTLVLTVLTVFLYSCNGKEDSPNPLVGTWMLVAQKEVGVEFKEECQELSYVIFTKSESEFHDFRKKGDTCVDQFERRTSYTFSNNEIHFESNGNKASIPFSLKDDVLTLTLGSVTITYHKKRS